VGWGLTFSQSGALGLMAVAVATLILRRRFADGLGLRLSVQ
jgi:hypothetical protein